MNTISETLNCKNICDERISKKLPVYNGGLGSNNIQQPSFFIESLKKFSNEKDYVSVRGINELQETIKNRFSNDTYSIDSVIVGNGLKELLFILQLSFEGTIFHITPSWVSYKEQILILNKENNLIEIESTIENNFKIDHFKLDNIFTQYKTKNKLLIFNNPNNPTGILYTPYEVKKLAQVIKKHNCIVLADEIYFNINHFNPIKSISEYIPDLTIIGSSVSKDMGCGGYRIGWLTFPKKLNQLSNKCASNGSSIYSCTAVPIQYATNEMLRNNTEFVNHCNLNNKIYKFVVNRTNDILSKSKLKYIKPESSWYIFLDFSNYAILLKKIGIENSIQLCNFIINKIGLVSVAGKHFNVNTLTLRVSLISVDLTCINYVNQNFDKEKLFLHMEEGFNKLVELLKNMITT